MPATAGKVARVRLSGAAVAFTNEATTDAGDHKTYQITNAAKRVFDPMLAVVVQRSTDAGATWGAAVGAYTLNRLTGTVAFAAAIGATDLIRFASGSYLPMSTVAEGTSFSLSSKAALFEDNAFGDTVVTRQIANLSSGGAIGQWWLDVTMTTLFAALGVVVVEIAIAGGATPIARAWGLLTERSHNASVGGGQDEPLTWDGTTDADGRTLAWLI